MAELAPRQASPEFEAMWDEEWERCLRTAALERVKRKVNPKMYQVFDVHVLQGWPVKKVVRLLKTNRAYIYLCKHRIGKLIQIEIQYLKSKLI